MTQELNSTYCTREHGNHSVALYRPHPRMATMVLCSKKGIPLMTVQVVAENLKESVGETVTRVGPEDKKNGNQTAQILFSKNDKPFTFVREKKIIVKK